MNVTFDLSRVIAAGCAAKTVIEVRKVYPRFVMMERELVQRFPNFRLRPTGIVGNLSDKAEALALSFRSGAALKHCIFR